MSAPLTPDAAAIEARTSLTEFQAETVESEMRRLLADPDASKNAVRLFMQATMPCGHAAGNLLTCSEPPFGCVICNAADAGLAALVAENERLRRDPCEHNGGPNVVCDCAYCCLYAQVATLRALLVRMQNLAWGWKPNRWLHTDEETLFDEARAALAATAPRGEP